MKFYRIVFPSLQIQWINTFWHEQESSISISISPSSRHVRDRQRSAALFTGHCSWQWAASRKCSLENNRILLLHPKQHPSAAHSVHVWMQPASASTEQTLCVNVEMQSETVTPVMCSLASPSIRLTFTLRFSTLASPLSNIGLHYFWMEVGVGVHVCLWEREREKRPIYESLCAEMPAAVIDLWIVSAQIISLFSQGRSKSPRICLSKAEEMRKCLRAFKSWMFGENS